MFRYIEALFNSIFAHIQNFLCPWHIPITKHIQTLRYLHIILNIFTKAQSWIFDAFLNAHFFYRCYLTSRVTLRIINVEVCSRIIQPYLVLLRHVLKCVLWKDVLEICSKFTWERPCRSAISIKMLCNFIKITLCHGCSLVNLLHIFGTPFPKNTSGGLLLYPPTSLKERNPTQVLSDEFWKALKTCCLQNTWGKIFY